jgi:hypothetical protein
MAHTVAIKALLDEWSKLKVEQQSAWGKFQVAIDEIEASIQILTDKPISDVVKETTYDDENPEYIKGTEDGI